MPSVPDASSRITMPGNIYQCFCECCIDAKTCFATSIDSKNVPQPYKVCFPANLNPQQGGIAPSKDDLFKDCDQRVCANAIFAMADFWTPSATQGLVNAPAFCRASKIGRSEDDDWCRQRCPATPWDGGIDSSGNITGNWDEMTTIDHVPPGAPLPPAGLPTAPVCTSFDPAVLSP